MTTNNPEYWYSTKCREKPVYEKWSLTSELDKIAQRVRPALNSELPRSLSGSAAGVCYPSYMSGMYGQDNPDNLRTFSNVHEIVHLENPDVYDGSSHGEYLTDTETARRIGHNELIRGPFFRPPINWN